MTPLEQKNLGVLLRKYGYMTVEEALERAMCVEELKRDCGPHDFAFVRLAEEQRQMEQYALLLEKEQNA